MPDKPARIAALKAEIAAAEAAHRAAQQERLDKLLQLSREFVAEGLPTAADREFFMGLQDSTESGTLGTQMQVEKSWGAAIAAAKRKPKWPFARALDRAGISLPEWARKHDAKVENVKSWLKKPGKGGRPVPRIWAERIAKEFPKVPAVPESWPNGIRE